jgi:hypothetical protein
MIRGSHGPAALTRRQSVAVELHLVSVDDAAPHRAGRLRTSLTGFPPEWDEHVPSLSGPS